MHMQIKAHKVIDDILETKRLYTTNKGNEKVIDYIIDIIRNSQKFFMGDQYQLHKLTRNLFPDGNFFPFAEEDDYTFFPYRLNYFEFYMPTEKQINKDIVKPELLSMVGDKLPLILVVDYNRDTKVFNAFKIDLHFQGFDGRPTYWIYPIGYRIQLGKNLPGLDRNCEFLQVWKPKKDGALDALLDDDMFYATTRTVLFNLYSTVKFLNTQGVHVKVNYPDKKLQKKRQKFNKEPFFTYHTLVLKPKKSRKYPGKEPKGLWKNPLHSVRERILNYTEAAPLFGHYVGKVKIAPLLRGDYRLGVKLKDYEFFDETEKTIKKK